MQLVAVLRKTCTVLAVIAMGWASFMIVYKSALGVRQHKNVGLVSELSPLRERESGVVREGGKSTSGLEPIPGAPIALALGLFSGPDWHPPSTKDRNVARESIEE